MTMEYEAPSAEILKFTARTMLTANREAIENRDNGGKNGGEVDTGTFEEGWGDW